MKRVLLLQTVALLLAANANAEGFVGGTFVAIEDSNTDVTSIDGRYLLGENFAIDGGYSYADGEASIVRIGGHAFLRDGAWLMGGYAGYEEIDSDGISFHDWTAAAEGQYFLDRATISALVSYGETGDRPFGAPLEQWAAGGDVRYFVTDNFGLRVRAQWLQQQINTMEQDGSVIELGAEYQFEDAPVSVMAGYRHTEALFDPLDSWGVGLRWNFGDATLLQRDHAGARLHRPSGVVETFAGGITLD